MEVQGSNPGVGKIFRTNPDQPWGPPSLLYNGYRISSPGGKAAGVCNSRLVSSFRVRGPIPPLPLYAFAVSTGTGTLSAHFKGTDIRVCFFLSKTDDGDTSWQHCISSSLCSKSIINNSLFFKKILSFQNQIPTLYIANIF